MTIPATAKLSERVLSIDVIRGLAMMILIVAHAETVLDRGTLSAHSFQISVWMTKINTVAFTFVSGMVNSYLYSSREDWKTTYAKLARRALLLWACHPLINIMYYPARTEDGPFWRFVLFHFPITDTIGFCLLAAPFVAHYLRPRTRVLFAAAALVAGKIMSTLYQPENPVLAAVRQVLFGGLTDVAWPLIFPFGLVPWLGLFTLGSLVGEKLAEMRKAQISLPALAARLGRVGRWGLAATPFLVAPYAVLRLNFRDELSRETLLLFYPDRLATLLPGYVGVILLVISYLLPAIDAEGRYNRFFWAASIFGRTSLFTFLIQFPIAMSIPALLGLREALPPSGFLVAALLVLGVCWTSAYWYGRARGWIGSNDYDLLRKHSGQRARTRRAEPRPATVPL